MDKKNGNGSTSDWQPEVYIFVEHKLKPINEYTAGEQLLPIFSIIYFPQLTFKTVLSHHSFIRYNFLISILPVVWKCRMLRPEAFSGQHWQETNWRQLTAKWFSSKPIFGPVAQVCIPSAKCHRPKFAWSAEETTTAKSYIFRTEEKSK